MLVKVKQCVLSVFMMYWVVLGTSAEAEMFSGTTKDNASFRVRTSLIIDEGVVDYGISMSGASANTVVDFDWSVPSMTFKSFVVNWDESSWSHDTRFTLLPGQTETLTTSLTFDSISASAGDFQSIALTPGLNGDYSVESGIKNGMRGSFPSFLTVTGNWEVVGPTESDSGTFSVDLPIHSNNSFPGFHTLETADYPNEMVLRGGGNEIEWKETKLNTYEVDTIVDGHRIQVDLYVFKSPPISNITMTHIPEPSTFLLTALSLLGIVWYGWRPNRVTT